MHAPSRGGPGSNQYATKPPLTPIDDVAADTPDSAAGAAADHDPMGGDAHAAAAAPTVDPAASGPFTDYVGTTHPDHFSYFRKAYNRPDAVDARVMADSGRLFGPEFDVLYADGTVGWISRPGGFDHSGRYSEDRTPKEQMANDEQPAAAARIRNKHGWPERTSS